MSNYQSHDGLPMGCVERSSHLEEYTRSRPASAGSRPKSLLNKMANAAAAVQLDDADAEPADAEPWVLDGWGDGPSVSEAAQQAALRLGPYIKNIPTTLVGLGAGVGRRVLSAGHQGRGPLKVSEARRKPGQGASYSQGDRRSSGPAALANGAQGATTTLRRIAMHRNLDVGDESDVEPTVSMSAGASGGGSYGYSGPPPHGRITPAQRAGAALRQQNVQQVMQNTLNTGTRLGRRETAAGTTLAPTGPMQPFPVAVESSAGGSPRHRSVSAETYLTGTHGAGAGNPAPAPNVSGRPVPSGHLGALGPPSTVHGHPPLPPQHLPPHLEPLGAPIGRAACGRSTAVPSDPGMAPTDRPSSGAEGAVEHPPARSSSFSSCANTQSPSLHDHHDSQQMPGTSHAIPGTASSLVSATAGLSQIASGSMLTAPTGQPGTPLLPGLFLAGRRGSSFRTDASGLSGWDPEAPAIQQQPPPGTALQAGVNVSLWIGPTVTGVGFAGAQPAQASGVAVAPGSLTAGRGLPLPGGQLQHRRDGSNRMQRGLGSPLAGIIDLSLGPERSSSEKPGQAATPNPNRGSRGPAVGVLHSGLSPATRSLSPDVHGRGCPPGFSAPQQDALTEFCASRVEIGSAGTAFGSISGTAAGEGRPPSNANGFIAAVPASVPLRVTSLAKATAVGRVS
ncbi:hypothetical protein VaNZ11_013616 [Volvox africanus]|uniref:Uncharacterized protein n=1 Tax=Volvox africanus TaxID=51714 RepID=A0ABQ5SGI3_9CHLO|nr:hypothetical protein VaNZ11_013616 [Volvox africanus]